MILLVSLIVTLSFARPAAAPPDTLRLGELQQAATQRDLRAVQPTLLEAATRLRRLENLRAERLPRLSFTGQATYQSEAASIPLELPNVEVPQPPLERFQVQAEADQPLRRGRLRRQAAVERAALAEQTAGVAVALYALREAVTEAYFGGLLLQAQAEQLALAERDLEARLTLTRARVQEGATLASEADALEAERIRLRQERADAEASRRASLDVLAQLAGTPIAPEDSLALPDLARPVADARPAPGGPFPEARPEFERFARTQDRLEAEAALAAAQTRPELSLFGQAGVGRPSPFEPFGDEADPFAQVGLRLQWRPFDWGRARREAAPRRLQATVTATEADAFADRLTRDVADDRAQIDRLEAAIPEDARAVALRENVRRTASLQLDEGALLAADYADRLTDLYEARLTLERHRIGFARARARYLTTLGLYPATSTPTP